MKNEKWFSILKTITAFIIIFGAIAIGSSISARPLQEEVERLERQTEDQQATIYELQERLAITTDQLKQIESRNEAIQYQEENGN